ncbi:uncharacterized protein LOC120351562 [Nilaparvata lugens]|uniref:uncharacterized protein LOC120351562 n=1 Tax=Nilaparvata lugens TaxID=108931 RepID=UPI00193D043F|nr:uncharacterized protein LOC120351562 [Nilaparvata lugens]
MYDQALSEGRQHLLGSISLKIQLLDEAVLSKGARSLEQIFSADNNVEGRKRKDQSGLMGLAMAMKASMLSMVMAGVAAMSGKALMVSMMALAFAALESNR